MQKKYRVAIVDIIKPHYHTQKALTSLQELRSLVDTYHGINIVSIIQHRIRQDQATFIGSGKMLELIKIVKEKHIDIVVINNIVNPTILFNITQMLWSTNPNIQVWDRVDLILNIFDKHAHTKEAKLQIEIARMNHMGPRIYGLGTYFTRQAGGIGTKGIGETNIELMKRHWRREIKKRKIELDKISNQHLKQLRKRKESNILAISIVGYTNAGKTSLFNKLTKKKKDVKSELFVTLDSVTGKIYFPSLQMKATVSDTIGFIKDLPSSLINSFKSTLIESIYADILLHVIDISDQDMNQKIKVVEQILSELQVKAKKIIYVFNKIDAYTGDGEKILEEINSKYRQFSPQFTSVTTDFGIDKLKNKLEETIININLK